MRNASHVFTRTRLVAVAIAAVLVAFAPVRPANADPPAFDNGVGAPTIGKFNPVTLNGTEQLTSASLAPFVIVDDSGWLAGWHVTLVVPTFLNGSGADCSIGATSAIPGANLSMNAPVVTAADAETDMTGVTTAGFTDFTTAKTIISATAGDGAGTLRQGDLPDRDRSELLRYRPELVALAGSTHSTACGPGPLST